MLKLNLLLILSCFLFSSCQGDLENESFINIEDEYEFFISQELSSSGGLAALNVKSTHELGCSNYSIPYQLEINQENIKLVLNKVSLEGECLSPSSYVNQVLDLGFQDSEKNITIVLQDIVSNSGKIKVTEDNISLNLNSNDGIKISKAKISRIKKNMMWGSIQNGSQSSIDKIKELFTSIDNGKFVTPGDYGLFYVANSTDLQFYDALYTPITSFALFSDSDLKFIEAEIKNIKESDPALVFNLTLFDGQTINVT